MWHSFSEVEIKMSDEYSPDVSAIIARLAVLNKAAKPSLIGDSLGPVCTIPYISSPQDHFESMMAALVGFSQSQLSRPEAMQPTARLSSLQEELRKQIKKVFREVWSERDGEVVPDPEDLGLGNDAVKLDATVLYADMNGSTQLVDQQIPQFAAEVYKTYLASAAKVIKNESGVITAYDGDRIMAVFIGNSKNTNAARAALKINWAVENLVNPGIREQYPNNGYQMKHVVGIDTSHIFASRIGVRNDNDIVWVGRAANYAAKLTALSEGYPIYITGDVYDKLNESLKLGGNPRRSMWERRSWTAMSDMTVYRSNWTWTV